MEKKSVLGGKLPNLAGFDYYIGGIYVMQGYKPKNSSLRSSASSPFVSEFDWRNRHGRNWMTPAKNQGCGDCWAFSAVGTTEAYVNLYYNQLLNLDLSEQDVLSCSNAGSCGGGSIRGALEYVAMTGIVNETCFEYAPAGNLPCSNKCPNPSEKIKIYWRYSLLNYLFFGPYIGSSNDDLKKKVIQSPMGFGIGTGTEDEDWHHAVVLTGFKTIQAGDSVFIVSKEDTIRLEIITLGNPLINEDAWILKNSWGTDWGDNGFGYVVSDWLEAVYIFESITSLKHTDADIVCEDRDGDGYYFWGVGPQNTPWDVLPPKPSTCPACAPDEPDGDDSNPNLGPMDEYGNCADISTTPLVDNITTSQTWNTNRTLCEHIAIQSGVTLTITATVFLSNFTRITIKNGGKLILSGGTIDDGYVVAENGSELTITNNGKVLLGNYSKFDVQSGAVFDLICGEVSLK